MSGTRGQARWIATGLFAILAVSFFAPSADRLPTWCLFHALTSLPCPSCGMTRAFVALGHGHLAEAMAFNLASPLVYAAAWLAFGLAVVQAATRRHVLALVWARSEAVVFPATLAIMSVAWMVNLWSRLIVR